MKQWLIETDVGKHGEARAFPVEQDGASGCIFYRGKQPKGLVAVVEKSAWDAMLMRAKAAEAQLQALTKPTIMCESGTPVNASVADLVVFWSDCVKRRRSQLKMFDQTLTTLKSGTYAHNQMRLWAREANDKFQHAQRVLQELDAQSVCLEKGTSV